MMAAEQNYRLLQEIEANRRFLLMAYQQNHKLLESAEMRIKQLFEMPPRGADNNQSSVLMEPLAVRLGEQTTLTKSPVISPQSRERGISLIELIMFIVIVSVALAGILLVMNVTTKSSADPLIRKQALAIAESLLEEVELQPFTYCDPNDVNAAAAVSAVSCSAGMDQDKGGAPLTSATPNTETRYDANFPYDNVADYGGFNMAPIFSITDGVTPIPGLGSYAANIAITRIGTVLLGSPADGNALLITVTVTGPGVQVVMDGIRTRYSPNP